MTVNVGVATKTICVDYQEAIFIQGEWCKRELFTTNLQSVQEKDDIWQEKNP